MIERGSAAFNGPSAAGAFLAIAAAIALTHAQVFQRSRAKYLAAGGMCVLGLLATICGVDSRPVDADRPTRWWPATPRD